MCIRDRSGSRDFKDSNEHKKDIDIIGQFGVGFYSAFMVAKKVEVLSKAYGSDEANLWVSEGIDGYQISSASKDSFGTDVILTIKDSTEEEDYDQYLETYTIQELIRKYSDYITYPIRMEVEHQHLKDKKNKEDKDEYETVIETETINSLVPLWKRNKTKISEEEYHTFYSDKFFDYEKPLSYIHTAAEGTISYHSLLYIPSHAPYDFYTKDYQKGLQLYSNGVLIMEKCALLLPDYFSFVKGVVDSPDLSLNISRETLQQDRLLKTIAKSLESKIKKDLEDMRDNRREDYEKFFCAFGSQLKFGLYDNYGMNKDKLEDLVMFYSSSQKKLITLKEYVDRKKEEQKAIYYACGESVDKIDMMPKVEALKEKYEILYCTEYVDEFALKMLNRYHDMDILNINSEKVDTDDEKAKEEINKKNEDAKDIFKMMIEAIPEVKEIRFTNQLKNHPVCLTTMGDVSVEMEKAFNQIPNEEGIQAQKVLEINESHPIAQKIKDMAKNNPDGLKDYAKVLYAEARLIEGLSIDNPTEISNLICQYLAK